MTKKLKRLTQEDAFKAMMNRELVYVVESTKDVIDLDNNYDQKKGVATRNLKKSKSLF